MGLFPFAVPNFYYLSWTHEARPHYAYPLVFGNILLLLAHKILYPRPAAKDTPFLFIALGLMAGTGLVGQLPHRGLYPAGGLVYLFER